MDYAEVNAVLEKTPVGKALLPILKDFEREDIAVYQTVAQALFRAYEIGLKETLAAFKPAPGVSS